ncbi:MAG: HAD family hydrolase [Chloroflexota bacterium]
MPIRAVFFDLGGVLLRTEYQSPRQHLAGRLGMEYDDLERLVFNSDSARKASIGAITEEQHWAEVAKRLRRPLAEADALRDEFFGGDALDLALVNFLRSIQPRCHTGLISNAWSGLRAYMVAHKFDDAFHSLTISAEVGVVKPAAQIYLLALEQARVQAGEAVFVDDFIENVEGARAVGMSAIHFREPNSALSELKNML